MTRKPGKPRSDREEWDALARSAFLLLCFMGAGLAGCLTVTWAGENSVCALSDYLRGYLGLLEEGAAVSPPVWAVVWELCRWPLLAFLLGLTAFGAVAIPAVFCARGFLLSYSIAAFVRVFGAAGTLAALAVFGTTALASVPVLFCVGLTAFSNSLRLAVGAAENRPAPLLDRARLRGLAPCGALLALAVTLQCLLMPQLLLAAAELLRG